MNGELYFEGEKYISVRRASEISNYSSDYISQLCRGYILKSRIIGGDWFVSEVALNNHIRDKNMTHKIISNNQNNKEEIISKNKIFTYTQDNSPLIPNMSTKSPKSIIDDADKSIFQKEKNKNTYIPDDEFKKLIHKNNINNFKKVVLAGVVLASIVLVIIGAKILKDFSFVKNAHEKVASIPSLAGKILNTISLPSYLPLVKDENNSFALETETKEENKILVFIKKTPLYFNAGLSASAIEAEKSYRSFETFIYSIIGEKIKLSKNRLTGKVVDNSVTIPKTVSSESFLKKTSDGTKNIFSDLKNYFFGLFSGRSKIADNKIIPIKNQSSSKSLSLISSSSSSSSALFLPEVFETKDDRKDNSEKKNDFIVASDITKREVLDLIKQYDDNNKNLIYATNAITTANSSNINQTLSELKNKIQSLEQKESLAPRQLDHVYNSISRSFDNITSLDGVTVTNSSFSGTTGTFSGNLTVSGASTSTFSGGLSANRFSSTATSTLAGLVLSSQGLTISTLDCSASGQLLQTDANGNVICGTDDTASGGGSFAWTTTTNYGTLTNATNTPIWFQSGLQASSTSHFVYASTTALTVSDKSYLGTVSSGIWNGSSIGNSYIDDDITLTNITQITNRAITDTTGTLTVARGGTGQTSFGQGWLNSDGTTLTSSTSPTVNYLVATSTTATSTFAGGLNLTSTTGNGLNFGSNTLWYQNNQRFLTSSTTSAGNLTIGYQSASKLDNNGGLGNTAIGYQAMRDATSSPYNTALGYQALRGSATISNAGGNTAIGYNTLFYNTSGEANTALGYRALVANTTGIQNVAVGYQALSANTTGGQNMAIGLNSLLSNITGSGNMAIGSQVLRYNTASNNTAVGSMAGSGDLTASTADQRSVIDTYATFIGYRASRDASVASTTALTNITAIGSNARVGASNSVVLGGTGADAVKVGIGTTTPWRTLSVDGTVSLANITTSVGSGSLCLTSTNDVVYNASDACLSSLRSTKHNIEYLDIFGLETVNSLEPVSFVYNKGYGDDRVRYGFIADDVANVNSHLATYNGSVMSGIDDRAILSVVVKAIKELNLNITSIASTSANVTPKSQSFATSFFDNLFARFRNWLADATNGIEKLFAKEVRTSKLCLDDVCVTKTELQAFIQSTSANDSSPSPISSSFSQFSSSSVSNSSAPDVEQSHSSSSALTESSSSNSSLTYSSNQGSSSSSSVSSSFSSVSSEQSSSLSSNSSIYNSSYSSESAVFSEQSSISSDQSSSLSTENSFSSYSNESSQPINSSENGN